MDISFIMLRNNILITASLRMKEIALISVSCLQTMDLICMSEADLLFGTKDILASKI